VTLTDRVSPEWAGKEKGSQGVKDRTVCNGKLAFFGSGQKKKNRKIGDHGAVENGVKGDLAIESWVQEVPWTGISRFETIATNCVEATNMH